MSELPFTLTDFGPDSAEAMEAVRELVEAGHTVEFTHIFANGNLAAIVTPALPEDE